MLFHFTTLIYYNIGSLSSPLAWNHRHRGDFLFLGQYYHKYMENTKNPPRSNVLSSRGGYQIML